VSLGAQLVRPHSVTADQFQLDDLGAHPSRRFSHSSEAESGTGGSVEARMGLAVDRGGARIAGAGGLLGVCHDEEKRTNVKHTNAVSCRPGMKCSLSFLVFAAAAPWIEAMMFGAVLLPTGRRKAELWVLYTSGHEGPRARVRCSRPHEG